MCFPYLTTKLVQIYQNAVVLFYMMWKGGEESRLFVFFLDNRAKEKFEDQIFPLWLIREVFPPILVVPGIGYYLCEIIVWNNSSWIMLK